MKFLSLTVYVPRDWNTFQISRFLSDRGYFGLQPWQICVSAGAI